MDKGSVRSWVRALAADDARATLDQLLRTVELAGHDPHQALTDAVTASSLDGSVAQVLHFRIRTAHEGRLTPRVAGYADLLPKTRRSGPGRPWVLSPTRSRTRTGGRGGSSGPAGPAPTASWSATTTPPTR